MKNMKRSVALLVAIALLIGCAAGGTMAWLTMKTDPVVNTFTTSDIEITLTETKGTPKGSNREFKMIPGAEIEKDPKVTVEAGSEACWLFVKVAENNRVASVAEGNKYNFFDYDIAVGWTELTDGSLNSGEKVYYRKQAAVATDTSEESLPKYSVLKDDKVTVSNKVTKNDMTTAKGSIPTLTFTAYAIQQEGFNDTTKTEAENAAAAWAEASK